MQKQKNMTTKQILFTLIFLTVSIISAEAQTDKNSTLFIDLKKQDSIFFERGFNQCDLNYLGSHIASDFKFYHDQSGFQDKKSFFENTKKYICSTPNQKPIRKVDEKSLEVFPLYNNGKLYGAIQNGIHDFYIREANKEDIHTSKAKFTHLWLLENENWLLKEVLSFDHNDPSCAKFATLSRNISFAKCCIKKLRKRNIRQKKFVPLPSHLQQ